MSFCNVFRILSTVSGLVDSFPEDGPSRNLDETCWSSKNSYRPPINIVKNIPGERLDFIFYHPGSRMQVEVKDYGHPLPDRVPNQSFSYSDHEAVASTLLITKQKNISSFNNSEEKKCVLEDCVGILNKALHMLKFQHRIFYYISAVVLLAMLILSCTFDSSVGRSVIFNILRIIVVILFTYCLLMATIWNRIEKHAILAGKLAIELSLKAISNES